MSQLGQSSEALLEAINTTKTINSNMVEMMDALDQATKPLFVGLRATFQSLPFPKPEQPRDSGHEQEEDGVQRNRWHKRYSNI